MKTAKTIYTLYDVARSLQSVVKKNYRQTYLVKAEIAKLNYYPKTGHCYPDLVDKTGNEIRAQIRANIWSSTFQKINKAFQHTIGEPLREGTNILCEVRVDFHPVYGLSLHILDIEPAFTLGEMARQKQQNIARLKKEKLFTLNKSLEIPLILKSLAVISVETSKGYQDFIKILSNNTQKFEIRTYLFPTVLQGAQALSSMLKSLKIIEKHKNQLDAVLIIRGGGGEVGLSCYDQYELAGAIATFPLPVITGIGHATNETIAEMVAFENKITPTDVAYFVISTFQTAYEKLKEDMNVLSWKSLNRIKKHKIALFRNSYSLNKNLTQRLKTETMQIQNISFKLGQKTNNYLRARQNSLAMGIKELSKNATVFFNNSNNRRIITTKQLIKTTNRFLLEEQNKYKQWKYTIGLLDPVNVLKRGYSLAYSGKDIIRSIHDVQEKQEFFTVLHDGKISGIIKKKHLKNER